VLPELPAIIAVGPVGELSIIGSKKGQPIRKEPPRTMFKTACKAAGISGKSAHGTRKAAATRAAMARRSLEAILGWEGGEMASLYTCAADHRALARGVWGKVRKSSSINAENSLVGEEGLEPSKS